MPIIDTLDSTPRLPSCSNPNQPDISPINPPDLSPDSESENMMVHTSVEDQRYVPIDSIRELITVSRHWHMCLTVANHSLLPHVDRFTSTRSSSNGTAQPSTSLHAPQPTKASGVHTIMSIECSQRRTDSDLGLSRSEPRYSIRRLRQETVFNDDDNVVIESQTLEVPSRDDDEELSPRGSPFATEAGHKALVKEKPPKPRPVEGDKESTQSKPSLKTR